MLALPSNIYVIERNKQLLGCVRKTDSTVFAFLHKKDAIRVKHNIPYYDKPFKLGEARYIMKRKSDEKVLQDNDQASKSKISIYDFELMDFCTNICINNLDVSLITNVVTKPNGLVLYATHETEVEFDTQAYIHILETMYNET